MVKRPPLGLAIGADAAHAVLTSGRAITWAGTARYRDAEDLVDVIARLAAEASGAAPARQVRVVLERDIVQVRAIMPVPPLKPQAIRRWLELEAPRLFRTNGAAVVVDGRRVQGVEGPALLVAAAPEPTVRAILSGATQAGLTIDALGLAAEILPAATRPGGSGAVHLTYGDCQEALEIGDAGVWRSRFVRRDGSRNNARWSEELGALGAEADRYAAAYGAARTRPALQLYPTDFQAARARAGRTRLMRIGAAGLACWALAGATYVGRLAVTVHAAETELASVRPAVDSALALRRELALAQVTVATVREAEAERSRQLSLLAALTETLDDSTHVVAWSVAADGTVRLAGYAPVATRVVAALDRVRGLREVKLEGPVTRVHGDGVGERDRFAVAARRERWP